MRKKLTMANNQKYPQTGGNRTFIYLLAVALLLLPLFGVSIADGQDKNPAGIATIKHQEMVIDVNSRSNQINRQTFADLQQLSWRLVNSNDQPADFDFEGFDLNGAPLRRATITVPPGETVMVAAEKIFPDLPTDLLGRIEVQSSVQPGKAKPPAFRTRYGHDIMSF